MYVQNTAKQKLATFLNSNSNVTNLHDIIISADTIISFNNKVIEKPESPSVARELLRDFKSNKVIIITAACIYNKNEVRELIDRSAIIMNDYTDEAIDSYLKGVPFMSIAGGIDVDIMLEMGMVKCVEGEMDVIRGFPVEQFLKICQQH